MLLDSLNDTVGLNKIHGLDVHLQRDIGIMRRNKRLLNSTNHT